MEGNFISTECLQGKNEMFVLPELKELNPDLFIGKDSFKEGVVKED